MTNNKILGCGALTCISLYGIDEVATNQQHDGGHETLLFTSITLYLSEAVLFWMFFTGLWLAIRHTAKTRRFQNLRARTTVNILSSVTETTMRRFCLWQVAFVAFWSIAFKGVLYTTLRHSTSHHLLAKGQSLGIAIPAELIIIALVLLGVAHFWLREQTKPTVGTKE